MRPRSLIDRRLVVGVVLALAQASVSLAQSTLTLDTFNASGATGAVIASPLPSSWVGNIVQNPGSITVGGTARDDNGWGASGLSLDASAMAYVRISGQRDSGNAASTFAVQLLDPYLNGVFFSVNTSAFAVGAPSQVQIPISSWPGGFDSTHIASWNIGGGTTGLSTFRMTIDDLSLGTALVPLTNGGTITTAGDQVYTSAVTLGPATVLGSIGSNGNAITFQSTVNGAQALTLNTPGTTTFSGAVGGGTPLASVTTDAGGNTAVNGGKVVTTGAQSYQDTVTLGGNALFESSTGGVVFAGSIVGNGHFLRINVAQASTLSSASNLAALTKDGAGTLTLTGFSTFTGRSIVREGTLALGVSNALASTSPLELDGGTFASSGFSQTFGSLTLASSSTIDFGAGASALAFADSSTRTWSGTLSILNYTSGIDSLRLGSSSGGLTITQLALLDFGTGFTAQIDANGYVYGVSAVPEPSTYAAIAGGAMLGFAGWRRRRRMTAKG